MADACAGSYLSVAAAFSEDDSSDCFQRFALMPPEHAYIDKRQHAAVVFDLHFCFEQANADRHAASHSWLSRQPKCLEYVSGSLEFSNFTFLFNLSASAKPRSALFARVNKSYCECSTSAYFLVRFFSDTSMPGAAPRFSVPLSWPAHPDGRQHKTRLSAPRWAVGCRLACNERVWVCARDGSDAAMTVGAKKNK